LFTKLSTIVLRILIHIVLDIQDGDDAVVFETIGRLTRTLRITAVKFILLTRGMPDLTLYVSTCSIFVEVLNANNFPVSPFLLSRQKDKQEVEQRCSSRDVKTEGTIVDTSFIMTSRPVVDAETVDDASTERQT